MFGLFMLLAGILWLIAVTYGLVLLPFVAVPCGYRVRTGRWPRLRKQHPVKRG